MLGHQRMGGARQAPGGTSSISFGNAPEQQYQHHHHQQQQQQQPWEDLSYLRPNATWRAREVQQNMGPPGMGPPGMGSGYSDGISQPAQGMQSQQSRSTSVLQGGGQSDSQHFSQRMGGIRQPPGGGSSFSLSDGSGGGGYGNASYPRGMPPKHAQQHEEDSRAAAFNRPGMARDDKRYAQQPQALHQSFNLNDSAHPEPSYRGSNLSEPNLGRMPPGGNTSFSLAHNPSDTSAHTTRQVQPPGGHSSISFLPPDQNGGLTPAQAGGYSASNIYSSRSSAPYALGEQSYTAVSKDTDPQAKYKQPPGGFSQGLW